MTFDTFLQRLRQGPFTPSEIFQFFNTYFTAFIGTDINCGIYLEEIRINSKKTASYIWLTRSDITILITERREKELPDMDTLILNLLLGRIKFGSGRLEATTTGGSFYHVRASVPGLCASDPLELPVGVHSMKELYENLLEETLEHKLIAV